MPIVTPDPLRLGDTQRSADQERTLRRAAEVLREFEQLLRESVTHPFEYQWSGDDDERETKAECAEYLSLARDLDLMADKHRA